MTDDKVDAFFALRSGDRLLVGRDRIALLEAVAACGSIAQAAKHAGFSYKTAWDAVNAINNLLPSPAFITKSGGKTGGGAEITLEGRRLIETFHRIEARLSHISGLIAEDGLSGKDEIFLWMLGARISVRNIFQTDIVAVRRAPVDVEVVLQASASHQILSIVTNAAADTLDLAPGQKVLALIKAPFIHIARPDRADPGSPNRFIGTLTRLTQDERNSEALIDIGGGKTLTAVAPRVAVERLALTTGDAIAASFDAAHVILAAN